jgi:hypothetical protein
MRSKALLAVLVAGAVLAIGWMAFKNNPKQRALLSRELATEGLAQYLAQKYPGQRALVISNPYTQRAGLDKGVYAQEEAGIRGLRKGFAGKVTLEAVVFPELKPVVQDNPRAVEIPAGSTTPLSFLMAEDAFDKLAQQQAGCDIIVSLIGLPADLNRVEAWKKPGKPRFALLLPDLRMVGDAAAIQNAVKAEKLAAFLLNKPGAPLEQEPMGKDRKVEFERRFVLVTPETVEQILKSYPQLFKFPAKPMQ